MMQRLQKKLHPRKRRGSSSDSFRLLVATACFLAARQWLPSASALSNAPLSLQEELGCSPTLSVLFSAPAASSGTDAFYFDPFNFAADDNFARYREAELKHGRLAMLSVVVLSGRYYYDSSNGYYHDTSNGGGVLFSVPSFYKVLFEKDHWSVADWTKFTVFCGLLEVLVYVQINPTDMPGDYGWGYFGERNKGKHERSLVCELENGRLAMMTLLFYLGNDVWHQGIPFPDLMNKLLSAFQQS
jgi:hypothetical protein